MNYRHELQNTGNKSCVSCLGWRWHGEKTAFMPRCSSAQRSVVSAWREKCKQVVSRVRGVCDDVTCPFLHSGLVQVLKAGQVDTNDPFCCPNSPKLNSPNNDVQRVKHFLCLSWVFESTKRLQRIVSDWRLRRLDPMHPSNSAEWRTWNESCLPMILPIEMAFSDVWWCGSRDMQPS